MTDLLGKVSCCNDEVDVSSFDPISVLPGTKPRNCNKFYVKVTWFCKLKCGVLFGRWPDKLLDLPRVTNDTSPVRVCHVDRLQRTNHRFRATGAARDIRVVLKSKKIILICFRWKSSEQWTRTRKVNLRSRTNTMERFVRTTDLHNRCAVASCERPSQRMQTHLTILF